jgi:hypothetical protein
LFGEVPAVVVVPGRPTVGVVATRAVRDTTSDVRRWKDLVAHVARISYDRACPKWEVLLMRIALHPYRAAGTVLVLCCLVGWLPHSVALAAGQPAGSTPASVLAIPTTTPQSQSASCCNVFSSPLEALVLSATGQPVGGVSVTFTLPSSGASGTFESNGQTEEVDTTESNGIATSSDIYTNGTTGTFTATASAPGVAAPANFSLDNTTGTPDTLTASLSTTPQSAEVGTTFSTPLQAVLTDPNGVGVSGVPVTFTTYTGLESGLSGSATATFAGGATSETVDTNTNGVATAPTLTANSATGPFVVTAAANGAYQPAVFDLTNLSGPAGRVLAIPTTTPQSQSASCCNVFSSPLEALVLSATGQPVGGVSVTFTLPSSGASGTFESNGQTEEVDTTESNGIATSSDIYTNGTTGTFTATASAPGVAAPANFSLDNTTGTPDTLTASLSTTPQSAEVGTTFSTPLQAVLTDPNGVGVSGVPVTFTTYTGLESGLSGSATATFAGGATSETVDTNTNGVATAPTLTANSATGPFVVTAAANGAYQPAVFDLTNSPPPPPPVGYLVLTSNGGVHNFHTLWHGSDAGKLPSGVTGIGLAVDPVSGGYWILKSNGGVDNFNAPWYGSIAGASGSEAIATVPPPA